MAGKDKLERSLARMFDGYQETRSTMPAVLGNGGGIVSVPDRPGYVYVRINKDVVQVYNERVPTVNNFPVFVGYDHLNPRILQVLTSNISTHFGKDDEPTWTDASSHRDTHEWMNPVGGEDTLFVQQRQILPLRIAAMTGTQTVFNYRGFVPDLEGGWNSVNQTYVDFSGSAPTGTLARYMLVSALPSGQLLITTGNVKSKSSLFLSDIPEQEFGTYPLAAVRVYGQQDQGIQESLTDTDIVDLRGFMHIRSSGTIDVYDNDIFEGSVRNLNFSNGLFVSITGTYANITSSGTGGGGGGAPTDAEYVTMSLDGGLSDERVLTAGTDLQLVDGGANGNATLNVIPGSFVRPDEHEIPVYDNDIFIVTGTILDFVDNLDVNVTGTVAYISYSGSSIDVYDSGAFEGSAKELDFNNNLTVTFAGDRATIDGQAGGTGSTVSIYEDSVFVTEVGSISFEDDIEVTHTGSVAFVSHVNCGTYQRVGQPVPLLSVTGAYWKIPEGVYATGSLSVFINGIIQLPIIDFDEFIPISGTYHYSEAPPTGSVHVTIWGVPCQAQPYIITGTAPPAVTGLRDSDGVLMLDSDGNQLQDSDGV